MTPVTGPLSPKVAGEIIAAAREYLRVNHIPKARLADAIGVSGATVSNLFNEHAAGILHTPKSKLAEDTRDQLLRDINNWLDVDEAQRQAKRPANFVNTLAADWIVRAARHVTTHRVMGVVYGPAGLGKTTTLRYLPCELPGVLLLTVDYDCSSARGLIKKISDAAGLRRRGGRPTLAGLVDHLRGSGRLLAIDQAHDLKTASCFKLLQDLHDACELPILFVGTCDIDERLRADRDPLYGQLSSRVQFRVDLREKLMRVGPGGRAKQWVNAEQLRRMFQSGKLRIHPEVIRDLLVIANTEIGALRTVQGVVRVMERLARNRGDETLTREDLRRAVRYVTGSVVMEAPPPDGGQPQPAAASAS